MNAVTLPRVPIPVYFPHAALNRFRSPSASCARAHRSSRSCRSRLRFMTNSSSCSLYLRSAMRRRCVPFA